MPPHSTENNAQATEDELFMDKPKDLNQKREPVLKNNIILFISILILTYYHVAGLYGLYLSFKSVKWATIAFGFLMHILGGIGVTAGAHRLWSHKSYKAKLPLQIILMLFHSIAFQKTVIGWSKHHRVHHKHCDTDADPHNAKRGFFFSHIGWCLAKRTDEFIKAQKCMDMSDIYSNPVLRFQKKYAVPLIGTLCFVLPTAIPMYFWGETLNNAWHFNMFRYIVTLNAVCCVNSVAHLWGYKPYDKNILPSQSKLLSLAIHGEGFHNYHHVFPWDYRTGELGNNKYNLTTYFIDFFSWVGWAYDLRTAPKEMVKTRAERTGDGTDLWGKMETIKDH